MAVDPSKTASKGGKDVKGAAKTGAKAKVKSPKEKLDPILAELLIVGLILFTLSVEVILHKLEHWIAHKHVQMQAVLRNLYRELMILGLVSFGFVLFVLLKPPTADLDKDKLIKFTFEIAHVFIFLFAVFYTFVVMSSVFMSLRLSARWKKLERMELVKYLEKKEKYRKLRDRMRRHKSIYWRYIRWWFPKINRVFRYRKLHEIMTFHDIRFQFIYYRNLPHDFRFSSFLRKVKSATFIELVEPHWSHYICFLLIVLLDLLRRKVNLKHGVFEPSFLIAESILNIVLVSIFAVKIRSIYWKMTKNPATYYDSVDRHVFEEELIIAEEQERIERESAVGSRAGSRAISRPTSPGPANLGVPGTPGEREITPEKEDGLRGSLDRPREPRGSRVSTEFRNRPRSSRPSLEHKHTPIYQNLAYKPPASVGSSGTATPHGHGEQSDLELEVVASRHSLDFQKDATLDLSKVATPSLTAGSSPRLSHADRVDRGQSHSARPSARSSFDKPGRYVPSLRKQDGTIALAEVAVAAAKRRSMEKPRNSDAGARGDVTPSRASLDDRARGTHTPVFRASRDGRMSNASARRTSVDLLQTMPADELAERDDDVRYSTASRRSVELAHAFPAEELAKRNQLPKNKSRRRRKDKNKDHTVVDIDADERDVDDEADPREGNMASGPSYASRLRAEAIRRVRKRKTANPSIIKNAIQREEAQQQAPTGNYPKWLLKLLPRLKRVASPAEKLFWFGSHRFYLWCVEWVLFFTTVNMAASATIFALEAADYNVVKSKGKKGFPFVHLGAFLAGLVTLFYVLMRIAGIMKKYVFVLNNANLVPETMTIQAIQTVSLKNHLQHDMYHEGDESDSSDNERGEGETASENRRKLWKFLSNDVEEGRIPGAESGAVGGGKRRISVASRRDSAQPPSEQVEAVASHSMDGSATAEAMWQP